jgi:thiol-disulfide isomerase/thioredoxin/TolA-binding protein
MTIDRLRVALVLLCTSWLVGATANCQANPAAAASSSSAPVPAPQTGSAAPTQPPWYESDPHFLAAKAEANKLSGSGELQFAIDADKKANKIAGGKCSPCLRQMITLQMRTGNYKDAAAAADELAAVVEAPSEKSIAEGLRGEALYAQAGEKPKPAQLEAAHEVFQAALKEYPLNNAARFLDATVLARMGQTDEARQQFQTCIDHCSPADPYYIRAKRFAANPAMSYAKMAPAFTVTALDGTKFTLDEMGGRVVLIDFWATWCGPCNEELPQMKKIAKEFAGQPLVIISVSWDSDEAKWKAFLAKNEMTWVQYRDADHELSKRFGVDAIPNYFTIDSDGVLTSEMLGSGNDVEGKLKKLVAKARAAQTTVAAATPVAASRRRGLPLPIPRAAVSIQRKNRPAKQVREDNAG